MAKASRVAIKTAKAVISVEERLALVEERLAKVEGALRRLIATLTVDKPSEGQVKTVKKEGGR